jgi:hypothetical protein
MLKADRLNERNGGLAIADNGQDVDAGLSRQSWNRYGAHVMDFHQVRAKSLFQAGFELSRELRPCRIIGPTSNGPTGCGERLFHVALKRTKSEGRG